MNEKKIWTKEEIKTKIVTDDKWLERALLAIYNRQTDQEQEIGDTVKLNYVGFSGAHARKASYMAKWVLKGNHLSGKWLADAKHFMPRYAGQLTDIANNH